jgi:hypothetical protein
MLADALGAAKLKITAAKQERICMGQPGFAGKRLSTPAYLYGQSGFCKPSLNGHVEGKAAMSAYDPKRTLPGKIAVTPNFKAGPKPRTNAEAFCFSDVIERSKNSRVIGVEAAWHHATALLQDFG